MMYLKEKRFLEEILLLCCILIGVILLQPQQVDAAAPQSLSGTHAINEVFEDEALAAKVADLLDKSVTDMITQSDLDGINIYSNWYLNDCGISSLEGIQYLDLTNLTMLDIARNNISDISALSNLTNLTELDMVGNNISDISVLSNLTSLTWVNLMDNRITDFTPIAWMDSNNYNISNQKKSISVCNIILSKNTYVYDGNQKRPSVTVKYGDIILIEGVSYTLKYPENSINVGNYDIIIEGMGSYFGSSTKSYTIGMQETTTNENSTEQGTTIEQGTTTEIVNTGDSNNVYILLMLLFTAIIGVIIVGKKEVETK